VVDHATLHEILEKICDLGMPVDHIGSHGNRRLELLIPFSIVLIALAFIGRTRQIAHRLGYMHRKKNWLRCNAKGRLFYKKTTDEVAFI
jgi:hypothetical protein